MISGWFRLLRNIITKYKIQIEDLYNFNEIGFIISIITSSLIITRLDRHKKTKSIQLNNRKWNTIIKCINTSSWCIPPFIIIKDTYHLSNWTTDSGFPNNWVIKLTANGWTNNKTGLNWIKHFNILLQCVHSTKHLIEHFTCVSSIPLQLYYI